MLVVIRGAETLPRGLPCGCTAQALKSGADRPAANVDPPHGMLFGSDSIGRNSR